MNQGELRRRALDRIRRDRSAVDELAAEDLQSLVNELQVHQVELEIQNEELREAQLELSRARDDYRDLYEHAPVGYLTVDAGGSIRRSNLEASRLAGRDRGWLLDRRLEEIVVPASRDACYLYLRRCLDGEPREPEIFELDREDEAAVWASVAATVQRNPDGKVDGLRVTLSDITAQRRAEMELHRLQQSLEQQVASRTAELQHKSGLLRELVVELSSAEDRERRRLADLLHDELQQIIVAAVFHLNQLIGAVADEKHSAGLALVRERLQEANELARSLAYQLSPPLIRQQGPVAAIAWLARELQKRHDLEVELVASDEIADAPDSLRVFIYQAVRELLLNVVKHADTDRARVVVERTEDRLGVTVADRGRGFDLMAGNGVPEPAGYGLRRLRERVEALDGQLDLRSAPEEGCRVRFTLPLATAPADPRADASLPDGSSGPPPEGREPIAVLVVDDHEVLRDGLVTLLADEAEIEVVGCAADGQEAIEQVAALQPDVVLMDFSLPDVAGDEVTRRIRERHPRIQVVGLSMYPADEVAGEMLAAGATAYLSKSESFETILAAVHRAARPD